MGNVTLTKWDREQRDHRWYRDLRNVARVGITSRTRKKYTGCKGVHEIATLHIEIESERGGKVETRLKERVKTRYYLIGVETLLVKLGAKRDIDTVKPLVTETLKEMNQRSGYTQVDYGERAAWNATAALLSRDAGEGDRAAIEQELRRRIIDEVPPGMRLEIRLVNDEERGCNSQTDEVDTVRSGT